MPRRVPYAVALWRIHKSRRLRRAIDTRTLPV